MSRKHDPNQHNKPSPTKPTQVEQVNDSLEIQDLSQRDKINASQMRNLQQRAGNRALLDALSTQSGGAELEAQEDHSTDEKEHRGSRRRQTPDSEHSDSSASMAQGLAFWDLLLGGEDDPPDDTLPTTRRIQGRRRRPWLPSKQEAPHQQSHATQLTQTPRRPTPPRRGQRFFYAMDVWLEQLEHWANPDPSPESLMALPVFHPLSRIHRSARFWLENGQLQSSRTLAEHIQKEPGNMGHCAQIARGLGMLDLVQTIEAQHTPRQQIADATAIALQESAFYAITELATASEEILTTDQLFRRAVAFEEGHFPDPEESVPHAKKACPLIGAALRYSIPPSNPAPILWSPAGETPPSDEDPRVAQVDALLKIQKPSVDLDAPRQNAQKLLHDCARLRLLLASAGLALWRTCGTGQAAALQQTLRSADRTLRRCALDIAQCIDRLAHASAENLRQIHQQLVDGRTQIQTIEKETHNAMIRLCMSTPDLPTPTLSFDDKALSKDLQTMLTSSPTATSTSSIPDCVLLTKTYFSRDNDPDRLEFAALCKAENNPWLWIRTQIETLKNTPACPTPETDETLVFEKEDRLAVRLWRACLQEVGRN